MAVRVRYKPSELSDSGVVETFEDADGWSLTEDGSLHLLRERDGKKKRVGRVMPNEFVSVMLSASGDEDEDDLDEGRL